ENYRKCTTRVLQRHILPCRYLFYSTHKDISTHKTYRNTK
ncbi:unnamed protein product, partial [Callosobruchus maculatus]